MPTLLEKARDLENTKHGKVVSKEQVELVLAWLKDEVTLTQVRIILDKDSGNAVYSQVARSLKQAFKTGQLQIKQ